MLDGEVVEEEDEISSGSSLFGLVVVVSLKHVIVKRPLTKWRRSRWQMSLKRQCD